MKVANLLVAFILVENQRMLRGRKGERLKLSQSSDVFLWTSLQRVDLTCPVLKTSFFF